MPTPLLQIKNLTIGLPEQNVYKPTIADLSLDIYPGETVALLGESGSGKSMTSLAIMQLLPDVACVMGDGAIYLNDKPQHDLLLLPEIAMRKIRGRRIAMIFQEPMTALNPVMSIGSQIKEVLKIHFSLSGKAAKARVLELLHDVGLPEPENQYDKFPHQLSGGMKQRVMIAMALAGEPDLLIADEPTSALDVTIAHQIVELLKKLQQKMGMAILFISHDLGMVKDIAHKIAIMYAGQLVEIAEKNEFFANPKHPYSQKLFASLPHIDKRKQALEIIPGNVPPLMNDFHHCRFADRCALVFDKCRKEIPDFYKISEEHEARCFLYESQGNVVGWAKEHVIARSEATWQSDVPTKQVPTKHDFITQSQTKNPILTIQNLKIYFPIHKGILKRTVGYVKAVDGVTLHIEKGKTLALVGESGCGKTTLAKSLLNLLHATSGEIHFDGMDVTHLKHKERKELCHYAQIVFQDPYSSMNPRMLVGEIIAEGMNALKIGKNKTARKARVLELLHEVGLAEESYYRYPHEFSGGQRQRIAIARALAVEPKLIICDEPTSALDVSVQAQILNLLQKLQKQSGISYLFITHNLAVVSYLADDIAVMHEGKIVEYGPAEVILRNPEHEYTKQLLKAVAEV